MSVDYEVSIKSGQMRNTYACLFVSSPGPSIKRRRWIRAGATVGYAPGSTGMGTKVHVWRSLDRVDGRDGWNLRLFHSFHRPCLTFLVHWRRR